MAIKRKLLWLKKHKTISIILLLVLVLVGTTLYQGYAERKNRQAFEQARATIDAIYNNIVTKIGPPDNHKRSNSCSRSYQEFTGYGPPTCDVDTSLIYGVTDQSEATNVFKKIQMIIKSHKDLHSTQPPALSITRSLVVNTYYHDAQDFYSLGSLKCTAKYVYDTPAETYLKLLHSSLKSLYVTIGCYGDTKQQYYPLEHR